MKVLSVNLPSDFAEAIEAWAAAEGKPVSYILSWILYYWERNIGQAHAFREFYPRPPKRPKPMSSIWDKL